MIKLPEPEITLAWCSGSEQWESRDLKHCLARKEYDRIIGYTEAQLKQAVRDFGEQCAALCARNAQNTSADEIRALIKEVDA